jgi:hypothetical protein
MKIPFSITATIFLLILTQSGVAQNSELKFKTWLRDQMEKSLGKIRNMTQDFRMDTCGSLAKEGKCIYRFEWQQVYSLINMMTQIQIHSEVFQ